MCQHGPRECAGNKIISCALIQIWDQTAQVDYVNCFMSVYQRSKHNDREFGQNVCYVVHRAADSILHFLINCSVSRDWVWIGKP